MPVFLFGAPPKNQHGAIQLLTPGMRIRWAVSAPDGKKAKDLSAYYQLGFAESRDPYRISYQMYCIPWNDPEARLLAVEVYTGQAMVSPEAIHSALPGSMPQAQRGADRMDGPRGSDGFVVHGDGALDASMDSFYAPPGDGTWTDIVQNRGRMTEIPRP